jgi:hypothetical protein
VRDALSLERPCGYVVTWEGESGVTDAPTCCCEALIVVDFALCCWECGTVYGFAVPSISPRGRRSWRMPRKKRERYSGAADSERSE